MSRNQFMLWYGFFTLAGLALSAVSAYYGTEWSKTYLEAGGAHVWIFFLGILAAGIGGILIAFSSTIPIISMLGYALLAGPFGLMLGVAVDSYTADSVLKVIFVTGALVGVLTLMGAVIPKSLEHWAGWLFAALVLLLVGQFGIPLAGALIPGFPVHTALRWWDWLGVVIFSFYVIYDVNRAMRVPATLDNAIDCAVALYLDVVNLFIRLLQIMGQKK